MRQIKELDPKLKIILLVSVVLRVAAAVYLGNRVVELPGAADQISYHNLALRVVDGHGFSFAEAWWPVTVAGAPTAHWSFIYTFYLAAVYAVVGPNPIVARLIQAVFVGLLQPYLAYRLADLAVKATFRVKGNNATGIPVSASFLARVPLLAAGVTAVYIYFIFYAATLMTEAIFITLLMAGLVLAVSLVERLTQPRCYLTAVALGLTLSLTVLLRQLFLLFIPFIFLWLLIIAWKQRQAVRAAIAISIVMVILILSILPFTIYNYSRFNSFVLLNTNAGYAFFWANHPIHGTHFIPASEMGNAYGKLIPTELLGLDEAALDRVLLERGLQFVADDPGRYVRLSLSRIPAYFKFWPDAASSAISNIARVGSFGLFLPFILVGLFRPVAHYDRLIGKLTWHRPSSTLALLYLFILVYTGIHILSWSLVRYRLPVDAVFVVFAAFALADVMDFIERRVRRQLVTESAV